MQQDRLGNADAASLADALAGAGLNVNETLKDYYLTNIINMHTEMRANRWTGKEVPTTVYDHMYVSAPGDWTTYQIAEVPPTEFEALGVPANCTRRSKRPSPPPPAHRVPVSRRA